MTMKKNDIVALTVFFAICLIPILFTNRQKDIVSEFDNRKLTELSDVKDNEKLTDHLETYLNDRIGFRKSMITVNQIWNAVAFGKLTHPLYDYGKEGYVFFKFDNDFQWEQYEYIALFSETLGKMRRYCEENGADFRVMINPSKEVVYSEYLPEGVHHRGRNTESLLGLLEAGGIKYTYTAEELIHAKEETEVFNRQYDAGHWNDAGAFIGIRKLMMDLSSDGYALRIPEKDQFYQEKVLKKYLLNSYFPINETIEQWKPYNPETVVDETYNEEIEKLIDPDHFEYECRKNPTNTEAPRILIFRGSYLENRLKFLTDSFSESLDIIGYGNISKFDEFFQLFEPDIVVFETADYAINENLYTSQVLNNTLCYNSGI